MQAEDYWRYDRFFPGGNSSGTAQQSVDDGTFTARQKPLAR